MTKIGTFTRITPLKDASQAATLHRHKASVERREKCSISKEILSFLSNFFFRIGNVVSTHPLTTIFCTLALVGLSSVGSFWLYREKFAWNLWLPSDAELYQNKLWMDHHFPQNTSSASPLANGFLQSVIISGENVLSPDSLKKISRLHNRIVQHLPDYDQHCIVLEELNACANFSVLRLWDYDEEVISRLSKEDVHKALQSLTMRVDKHYYLMTLRDIFETPDGSSIAGAKAILLTWTVNGVGMYASAYEDWYSSFEKNFYESVREMKPEFESLVYSGGLAFDRESTAIFIRELKFVLYGYAAVFIFMVVQMRYDGDFVTGFLVAVSGLAAVGLSVILMICSCSLMGLFWTNVSLIIPAILLGIGIDDMFVIIQTIKVEKAQEMLHPPMGEDSDIKTIATTAKFPVTAEEDLTTAGRFTIETRPPQSDKGAVTGLLSRTLGKVGLSIFVTSLSDVLAFVVGSSFIMPATSSLCVWLGVGISFVFVVMNTFFVACLALIERFRRPKWRKEILRERKCNRSPKGSCFSLLRLLFRPSSRRHRAINLDIFAHLFKKFYVPFTVTRLFSVISCVSTLGLLSVCVYGITQVELQWDVWKLIPEDSFLHRYKEMALQYFPQLTRMPLQLVFRDMNFVTDLPLIARVVEILESKELLHTGHNWLHSLRQYIRLQTDLEPAITRELYPIDVTTGFPANDQSFYYWIRSFLDSGVMKGANKNLYFDKEMAYEIVANTSEMVGDHRFSYHPLRACQFVFAFDFSDLVKENMDFISGITKEIIGTGIPEPNVFLFSHIFISIEQERFLPGDLTRNICLSLLLIGAVVCVFFADLRMSLLCSLTVLLSLIDVFGLIHYYGLTLEPVSAMTMTILIGLGIDFSIHVGHAFIFAETESASRPDRVRAALSSTGPAVIHGGLSTAIAMAPLVPSAAYAFQAFSKLIVSMVVVGLWHGLVFLPTLLLWFGPSSHGTSRPRDGGVVPLKTGGAMSQKSIVNKNDTVTKKQVKRKKRKRSCVCQCVNAEKEISTIKTYSLRARQATSPLHRRARLETRRRSRHHDRHNCHSYLVTPPEYLRQWLSNPEASAPNGRDVKTGSGADHRGLPRIPRPRILSPGRGAGLGGSLPRSNDDPRLQMEKVNVFRPIKVASITGGENANLSLRQMTFPPGEMNVPLASVSPASPHPACPPTPPPTLVISKSLEVDKDSLFNSSFHPANDLDDFETNPSANPSTVTMTPATSLSSINTGLTTPGDTDLTSDAGETGAEDTLVTVETRQRMRHTSMSISVSMGTAIKKTAHSD